MYWRDWVQRSSDAGQRRAVRTRSISLLSRDVMVRNIGSESIELQFRVHGLELLVCTIYEKQKSYSALPPQPLRK